MSDITTQQTNTAEFKNVFGKKMSVPKESTIGAGVGGTIGATVGVAFVNNLRPILLTKDEFLKQSLENAKNSKFADTLVKAIEKNIESDYSSYKKMTEKSIAEVKALLPKIAGKFAVGAAVAGAAIGFVIHLVKTSKAKKDAK